MLSQFIHKKKDKSLELGEMSKLDESDKKEIFLQMASSKLINLEKLIQDKKEYLIMLNNNPEYKQKMKEKDADKNFKAWVVYSYPENVIIDDRADIYKDVWFLLNVFDKNSVKEFKKIKLYDTLHSRFSSYDFNDTLFEEIEKYKNNMFAEGKRKRKKRKTKRKKSKRKKTKKIRK